MRIPACLPRKTQTGAMREVAVGATSKRKPAKASKRLPLPWAELTPREAEMLRTVREKERASLERLEKRGIGGNCVAFWLVQWAWHPKTVRGTSFLLSREDWERAGRAIERFNQAVHKIKPAELRSVIYKYLRSLRLELRFRKLDRNRRREDSMRGDMALQFLRYVRENSARRQYSLGTVAKLLGVAAEEYKRQTGNSIHPPRKESLQALLKRRTHPKG